MSDRDPKDLHDIEADVIDTLLDAIDDWDLEADFAPTDPREGFGIDAPPTAVSAEGAHIPLTPDEDDTFAYQVTPSDAIEADIDAAAKTALGSPLYLPPLDASDGTDEESTRMIDMRADESYHDLVRSIREEEEGDDDQHMSVEFDVDITVDTPIPEPVESPAPAPQQADQLHVPPTVMVQAAAKPLLVEEEAETHIYTDSDRPAEIVEESRGEPTASTEPPVPRETPSPWDDQTTVSPSRGEPLPPEAQPSPIPGRADIEGPETLQQELPSWVSRTDTSERSEAGGTAGWQTISEREIPEWVEPSEQGQAPQQQGIPTRTPLSSQHPSAVPVQHPATIQGQPPSFVAGQHPSTVPGQHPSAAPSHYPSAKSSQPPPMPSLPPIPPASEEHLPNPLVATLDNLLPRIRADLPTVAVALPSTQELLSRLDRYQDEIPEDGPPPAEPGVLASRCESAADASVDVAEAASFLCEAARIRERVLGELDRARELYLLALQLDGSLTPAISGQRRLLARTQLWDGLESAIDSELAMNLGHEERLELMLLKAEYALSAVQDPGRALDLAQEIESSSPEDLRASVLRAEVAYLEHDEVELGTRALKLGEALTDADFKASLFDIGGRISENISDHENASRFFEAAARLNPTSPSVLAAVARLRALTGDQKGSAGMLLELSDLFGLGSTATSLRRRAAVLYLANGEPAIATTILAESSEPLDLLVLLNSAYVQNDLAGARDVLLQLAPITDDLVRRASYLVEAIIVDNEVPSEQLLELLKTCFTSGRNITASVVRSELARRSQDVDSFVPVVAGGTDGASPFAMFRSALNYDSQGRADKAHELFAELATIPEGRIEAELALLVLTTASQNWTTLVDFLHKASDHSPSALWKASVMVQLGRIHEYELKDRIAARAGYAQAAELIASSLPALQGLKRTAPDGATKVEAARRLAEGSDSRLDAVSLHIEAGRVAEESSDVAGALDAYYAALSNEPSAVLPLLGAERLLRSNQRVDELQDLWRQAAGATLEGLSSYHGLCVARSLDQRGESQPALEALVLAHEAMPSEATAGSIVRLSQKPSAAERLEIIAEHLPENRRESAFLHAAELALEEDPDGAIRCVETVLESNPDRADASMLKERLLPLVGRSEELESHLEEQQQNVEDIHLRASIQERLIELANDRGDLALATERCEAMLEIDPGHMPTLQWLSSRYLSDQRWDELGRVFELLAKEVKDESDAAAFAAMAIRLHAQSTDVFFEKLEIASFAVERLPNDLRALLNLYSAAKVAGKWDHLLKASSGLAKVIGLPRGRAVFELRAADALEALERFDEAEGALSRAASGDEPHPVAPWRLSRVAERQEHFATAADAAESAAKLALLPEYQTHEYLRAARLWLERANEPDRALRALNGALTADPSCDEAYELAKTAMTSETDPVLSLDLVSLRLKSNRSKEEIVEMGTKGATLAFGLGERDRAKSLLRSVLEAEPTNIDALSKLGDAFAEDSEWSDAAQCFIHLGRLIKEPKESIGYYHRLGVIYQEKLPDLRKAIASFQKVLSFESTHLDTLRRLSKLLLEASEWKAACDVTMRLTKVEPLPELKRAALIRLAHAQETGISDTRSAEQALDAARRLDPTDIDVVEEIAAFYTRQGAQQALMVHLDRAATDFRRVLETNSCDMSAYHALFKVFMLRRAEDSARMAAAVLDTFGAAQDAEKALLNRYRGAAWVPTPAVADIRLDDDLSPPAVTASLRTLFQQIGDGLGRLARYDLKRLGLGRGQRVGRGVPIYDLAQTMMPWYGLNGVELYLHPSEPMIWMPIVSPPAIVVGRSLIDGCSDGELRFLLGRGFTLLQRKLAIMTQLPPERLGLLLPAIVKLVSSGYEAEGVDAGVLSEMVKEVGKALPKRHRQEAGPLALECVGALRVGPSELLAQVEQFADRGGLLAAGGLVPAIMGIRRLSGVPPAAPPPNGLEWVSGDDRAGALLQFYVSKAHASARSKLGFASPL